MNEIQIFNNSEFGEIRTIEENGKVLFCGADVAKALGYARPKDAISAHCKGAVKHRILTNGGMQEMNFITEGDVYRLVTHSKLPNAERFEVWVFDEVLPTIRKTGSYTAEPVHTADDRAKALEVREMNARVRMSNQFLKLAGVDTLSPEYRNILVAKSAEVLTGEKLLPLPKSEQKTYSAGDIAEIYGVTAQKVGRTATKYNMKNDEYGSWYRDKSPYSTKEIGTFRYNDKAIEKFREIFT